MAVCANVIGQLPVNYGFLYSEGIVWSLQNLCIVSVCISTSKHAFYKIYMYMLVQVNSFYIQRDLRCLGIAYVMWYMYVCTRAVFATLH